MYPLTEHNVKLHTYLMRTKEIYTHYHALYRQNMDDFIQGRHNQMYDLMLPIANYQMHENAAIADMQALFFNSFMILNFDIYNSPKLKMQYRTFSETEYNRLFSARQMAQKKPQNTQKNRITTATLCL